MRATRSASKHTPPPKKAAKVTPSKAAQTEKKGNDHKIEEATSDALDRNQEINVEIKAHDIEEKVATATHETVNTPNHEEVTSMEESSLDQKHSSVKEDIVSVDITTSTAECSEIQEKTSGGMEVVEDYRLLQEVRIERESEEQIEGLENEGEENVEGMEEYNEEEEVEEVEEIKELEEVEPEEEEEVEEVEEVVEGEEGDGEGEGEGEGEGGEGGEEGGEEEEVEENNEAEVLEQRPVTERQKRKKFEIFVGGLDREATEDDVRKAFESVGEVVEIRLMRHPQTGKNKGYAFVRFAAVDQAKKAATELGRTKIRDKECGVVPSEDNDTLFLGNISKSWKKEQVLEKLKEYGVEGVEEVTLMTDSRNEELNRGYAFLELATHNDAVKAFVRLRKPDAIFGYDRSIKVSWAEPLLDEDVLAKVKSVFVDVIPPSWDESKVREHFVQYGEIERVVLAKDNPKSKRNDYAFVDYVSRESAVACVEALKNGELNDGDNKVKVTVAFSKSLPREKNIIPSRGGYPAGSRPFVHGRGWASHRGSFSTGRGRGFPRGGRSSHARGGGRRSYDEPRFVRGPKKHIPDERPFYEDRSRFRTPPAVIPPRPARGAPRGVYGRHGESSPSLRPDYEHSSSRIRGSSSRRGRQAPYRDEYSPRGGRYSSGFPRGQAYSSRPTPRDATYSRMPERDLSYVRNVDHGYGPGASDYLESGPGIKRPYAVVDEYYDVGLRGYPRPRVEYAEEPVASGHYNESARAPLRSPLSGRSAMPPIGSASIPPVSVQMYDQSGSIYASGGRGYPPLGSDYGASAGELRGGSYNTSAYGGRAGSGYGLPGSGTGSYY